MVKKGQTLTPTNHGNAGTAAAGGAIAWANQCQNAGRLNFGCLSFVLYPTISASRLPAHERASRRWPGSGSGHGSRAPTQRDPVHLSPLK
jgi:hypothetical protein